MIRLKHILAEISLTGVEPYTTHFTWRARSIHPGGYADGDEMVCEIECNGHPVFMSMYYTEDVPNPGGEGSWDFSFFVRTQDDSGWTVQQDRGTTKGALNTLRFFKTIGLALRAFITTHPNIDVINITGSDHTDAKGAQKSRVYAGLIASNPELSDFRVQMFGRYNQLYLVRKNLNLPRPDASGIDTPGDPNM